MDDQFQIAVSILFVTYLAFEVPSNLVLKPFTPSRWIAFIAFAWGIIAFATGFVQSFGGLIATRLVLGAVEAALEEDLGLVDDQFQIAVSILFVTYLAFEVPSNLVLKPFTPSRWIAFIAFAWGIIAFATGFVQSFGGLIATRLVLGAVEAA